MEKIFREPKELKEKAKKYLLEKQYQKALKIYLEIAKGTQTTEDRY